MTAKRGGIFLEGTWGMGIRFAGMGTRVMGMG